MAAAAAAWDVLSKAANLAQMSTVLVSLLTSLLRVQRSNRRECARLERCHRRLQVLLHCPATGCGGGVALLLSSEMGDPFSKVLGDAAALVESYKESTLWRRVRGGSIMATQLRDMHDILDFYCELLLLQQQVVLLLLQQQAVLRPPPSSDTTTGTTILEGNDDTSQSPSAQTVASRPGVAENRDDQSADERGMDTDPAGCGANVPDLLHIVISHP